MGVMDMGAFANGLRPGFADRRSWTEAGARDLRAVPEHGPFHGSPGYRSPRPKWALLAGIMAFHFAAIVVLATLQLQADARADRPRITTFSVENPLPPPPPTEPAAAEPVVQTVAAPVAAPEPPIRLPTFAEVPAVALDTRVEPVAPAVAPAPAPAAPRAQAPGPAPIVPPDFKASQLNNPGPSYPYLSRKAHEEGEVLLRVLVSAEGRAAKLEIEKSSGYERLDEAALKTVRKWRFLPASQGGKAKEAWVLVPVTFSLG